MLAPTTCPYGCGAHMLKKDWAGAKHTLELAASKKDGWGWGVNNGDIWISLGAVQLIEWGEAQVRDDAGSSSATMAGLEEANATLQKAANRTATHPWTLANLRAVDELGAAYQQGTEGRTEFEVLLQGLIEETIRWCEDLLQYVRPKPRPERLPSVPW